MTPRLLEDIRNQPASLRTGLDYHAASGKADLLAAARLLSLGPRVCITGMGASFNAAVPFYTALAEAGLAVGLAENAELLYYLPALLQRAVVLIVSRSGESVEALKLQAALAASGAPVIAVTNEPHSALARQASVHLRIGSLNDEMVAIQSYTGTLLALHLLGAAVRGEFDKAVSEVDRALGKLPGIIAGYEETSLGWNDFLEPGRPVYALGRGYSAASALETALLFGETAKEPAIGLTAATFRHGPVEVVDSGFRGVIFAPAGRTRDLNLALAVELARLGGQVLVAGPRQQGSALQFWPSVDVSEALAPLFEIVPLQLAALRLAEWKGIRPGQFRNTGQVTRDEVAF